MLLSIALLVLLATSPATSLAADRVDVVLLDLGGRGQDTQLTIGETWPLSYFTTHIPVWDPWTPDQFRLPDGIKYHIAGRHLVIASIGLHQDAGEKTCHPRPKP